MQPFSRNQRPDFLNMSLVLFLPREVRPFRSSSNAPGLAWKCYKSFTFCSLLTRCATPCACYTKRYLKGQKRSVPVSTSSLEICFAPQRRALFNISTCKTAPEHFDLEICFAPEWGAFFDISISNNAPRLRRFAHFGFQMCFAPHWHGIFHLSLGQLAPHSLLYFSELTLRPS